MQANDACTKTLSLDIDIFVFVDCTLTRTPIEYFWKTRSGCDVKSVGRKARQTGILYVRHIFTQNKTSVNIYARTQKIIVKHTHVRKKSFLNTHARRKSLLNAHTKHCKFNVPKTLHE